MSTSESEELGRTAPIEVPPAVSQPEVERPLHAPAAPLSEPPREFAPAVDQPRVTLPLTSGLAPAGVGEVTYVPLAVTVGDGFKFGCGFFMAAVLALLVGFVLLAALFALTTVFGLNLPLTR